LEVTKTHTSGSRTAHFRGREEIHYIKKSHDLEALQNRTRMPFRILLCWACLKHSALDEIS